MNLCSGSKIFSSFIAFLKSKDASDGTEEALLNELTAFNTYLEANVSRLHCLVYRHCMFDYKHLLMMPMGKYGK